MKRILLLITLAIAGCDSRDELLGHWVSTDKKCDTLCSFTIVENENAYSNISLEYDKGPFYKGASGSLEQIGNNKYLVKGSLGDSPIVFKNRQIYFIDGSIYRKDK